MSAPPELLDQDVPEAVPGAFTPTRWGPRPSDPRTVEQRRAEFAHEVKEQRLRILAFGLRGDAVGAAEGPRAARGGEDPHVTSLVLAHDSTRRVVQCQACGLARPWRGELLAGWRRDWSQSSNGRRVWCAECAPSIPAQVDAPRTITRPSSTWAKRTLRDAGATRELLERLLVVDRELGTAHVEVLLDVATAEKKPEWVRWAERALGRASVTKKRARRAKAA